MYTYFGLCVPISICLYKCNFNPLMTYVGTYGKISIVKINVMYLTNNNLYNVND